MPAKLIISYWTIKPEERGDIGQFSFPLHRPLRRDEINEEMCPICLKDMPKAKSWVVFDGCTHATCFACFKRLVGEHRLHAACPMCRSLLAVGEGDRGGGGPKPAAGQPPAEEQPAVTPVAQPTVSDQV